HCSGCRGTRGYYDLRNPFLRSLPAVASSTSASRIPWSAQPTPRPPGAAASDRWRRVRRATRHSRTPERRTYSRHQAFWPSLRGLLSFHPRLLGTTSVAESAGSYVVL